MAISLFPHNEIAYKSAMTMLAEKGKAAIIHPTGTGKSFIGFKLCEDNANETVCWLSPSEYIFKTQLENLKAASKDYIPDNIKFITYARLMNMTESEISDLKPRYIILDEFHRCGAEMWSVGVEKILNTHPDSMVLGLSATAIRYLDNRRNMSDELFNGNVASEISLGEAIVRGILNPPKYVLSVFSYQKDLEKYQKRIKTAKNKKVREKGEKYLEALRRALENADGLDEIFNKHMTDRKGKYIVFCSNVSHMQEMVVQSRNWFSKVDKSPNIYTAFSDNPETSKAFSDFKADKSDHLKLLFCIDMLNEGVHVEDISGVILLRPTVSPIIYKQQIGRALSAAKKCDAVIFDIVLNIESLYSIGTIEDEMQKTNAYYRSLGMESEIVNEHFKVEGEIRDCIELFERLGKTLGASWEYMYHLASEYYLQNGNLNVPVRYMTDDGYSLGSWLTTQRKVYNKKINGTLSDSQISKLEKIGMRWENGHSITWERNLKEATDYYNAHGNLLVNINEITKSGFQLGKWIAQLRMYKKGKIKGAFLSEERIKVLDSIGMVWDVPDYLWERNFAAAQKYYEAKHNLNVPCNYVDIDGIKLGAWIARLRNLYKSNSKELTVKQIVKLNQIGMIWADKYQTAWYKAFAEVCEYKKKYGNLDIPVAYVSGGIAIGKWIRRQRESYTKGMSNDRIELLSNIGMIWEIPDPWEEKIKLVEDYYNSHGNLKIPNDYVVDGVWIRRWLGEQKARLNGKSKGNKNLTPQQISRLEALGIKKDIA